ncbi:hypothetical protein [Priestia sp. YIM B13486]|uniref:hypothetical protein n=1 Tax=Priestia sp. YIM B13486 TaxID=3366304 RepID=UPI0036715F62
MAKRQNRHNNFYSNNCQCDNCQSNALTTQLVGKTISGFIPANGQNPRKLEGDFVVTKSTEAPGVYTVRYNPRFDALIPGLSNPIMIQAFLPLTSNNCNNTDSFGLSPNVFASVLNYNTDGFRYLTFQIIDDQIVQKDLDVQFAAFGLVEGDVT